MDAVANPAAGAAGKKKKVLQASSYAATEPSIGRDTTST
jgi:hypothetical protein